MSGLESIGLLTAFIGGLVSFFSPCTLPLVPGYLSFIGGQAGQVDRLWRLVLSVMFILGFTLVFIALGAGSTALGQLFREYQQEATWIGGGLMILFGAFMAGLVPMPWLQRDTRSLMIIKEGGTPLAAFGFGLVFAFGWTPCIGPILGSILAMSSLASQSQAGMLLLLMYSLGLAVPFLLAALFLEYLQRCLSGWGRIAKWLHRLAGVLIMLMGWLVMTGVMSRIASWMLRLFPAAGSLG